MRIYKITNRINGKCYVGRTSLSIEKRFRIHKNDARRGVNYRIHQAIRKYGEDNFIIEELDVANSIEELKIKEEYWIKVFNSVQDGYNCNSKSGGISYHTSEAKEKIRNAKLGIKLSEEHRKSLSRALKGRKQSLKNIEALRISAKNRVYTDEMRKNLSDGHCKYFWEIVKPDGGVVVIKNLRKFSIDNNLNPSCMHEVALNRKGRTQHKGYKCKRLGSCL